MEFLYCKKKRRQGFVKACPTWASGLFCVRRSKILKEMSILEPEAEFQQWQEATRETDSFLKRYQNGCSESLSTSPKAMSHRQGTGTPQPQSQQAHPDKSNHSTLNLTTSTSSLADKVYSHFDAGYCKPDPSPSCPSSSHSTTVGLCVQNRAMSKHRRSHTGGSHSPSLGPRQRPGLQKWYCCGNPAFKPQDSVSQAWWKIKKISGWFGEYGNLVQRCLLQNVYPRATRKVVFDIHLTKWMTTTLIPDLVSKGMWHGIFKTN